MGTPEGLIRPCLRVSSSEIFIFFYIHIFLFIKKLSLSRAFSSHILFQMYITIIAFQVHPHPESSEIHTNLFERTLMALNSLRWGRATVFPFSHLAQREML